MEKFNFIVLCICTVILGITARPQNPMNINDIIQVDGFSFDGPVDRTNSATVNNRPSTEADVPLTTETTPSSPEFDICLLACQATSEFNPICGTDGVVYSNPGRLTCAQRCGKTVQLLYYGPCSTSNARG